MERVRESFNVNGPALAAGEAALGDEAHLQWACARNAEQRAALTAALRPAWPASCIPSQTNFVLVEFGAAHAAQIEADLVDARRRAAADGWLRPAGVPAHHRRHAR